MDFSSPLVWIAGAGLAAVFLVWVRRRDARGPSADPFGAAGAAPPTVEELMRHGRKIEAIKLYREEHRVGLREAKEAVEALASGRTPTHAG